MSDKKAELPKKLHRTTKLIVKPSPLNGYGVFAFDTIKKGETIEEAVFSKTQYRTKHLTYPEIRQLCYTLPCDCETCKHAGKNFVISSGFINLYNSTRELETRNIKFEWIHEHRIIRISALVNIKRGEELLTYYGPGYTMYDKEVK